MNENNMKRIFLLLFIAFLVSCTSQPEKNTSTDSKDNETEAPDVKEDEATNQITTDHSVLKPDELLAEPEGSENGELQDQETAYWFRKGTSAYNNNDYEGGIECFIRVLAKEPEDPRAYYNLGVGYFKLNNFYDALQAFNNAIEISPDNPLFIQYRGKVYYMLEDFRNCLVDYNKVVKLTPEDYIAYFNRGIARGQVKDYLGAIKDFDKAIEINPDYAEAYFNRGLANHYQGRLHEACYDWRKAHSLGHYESDKAIRGYCEGTEQ